MKFDQKQFKERSCKARKVYLDFLIQFDNLVQLMCWINSFTFCVTTDIVIFWLLLFLMRSQLTFFLFPRMEFIFFLCFWDFLFILDIQQFEYDGPMYGFVYIFTVWVLWTFWIYMLFLLKFRKYFWLVFCRVIFFFFAPSSLSFGTCVHLCYQDSVNFFPQFFFPLCFSFLISTSASSVVCFY